MNASVSPEISIIVPVFNEALNLKPIIEGVIEVMRPMGRPFCAADPATDTANA